MKIEMVLFFLFSICFATKINHLDAPKTLALEKLVSHLKSKTINRVVGNETKMLDVMAATVCPDAICCILVWDNNAPTETLTTPPCSNNIIYSSNDATVAGCNVIADTSNTPCYASSGCSLLPVTFTSVVPAQSCSATSDDVCVTGTATTPPGLNIGPTGCTPSVGACDCNGGVASGCTYPTFPYGTCNNNWVLWNDGGSTLSTITGTISDGQGGQITVTATAPSGVLVCTSDYWQSTGCSGNYLPPVAPTSPYTAQLGQSAPNGATIPFFQNAEAQTFTITFSSLPPCPPTIAFISFNGNTALFDTDFMILSQTALDYTAVCAEGANPTKYCGYWGCGKITRAVSPSPDPTRPYQAVACTGLEPNNEPHFVLQLIEPVLTFSFTVVVQEYWNGIHIGY